MAINFKWLIAGLCLLFFISCKPIMDKPKYPIIPKEEFIKVLVKFHIAQGMATTSDFRDSFKYYKTFNIVDSAIVQTGYSKAIFDSTVAYYSGYPKDFDEIYDKVISELNRMETELRKEEEKDKKKK